MERVERIERKMEQKPISWIYRCSKNHLWAVALLAGASAAIAGSFLLLALISSALLDVASGSRQGSLWRYCLILVGLIGLQAILNIVNSNIRVRVSGKLEMELKRRMFAAILRKPYLEISGIHSGEIMNRLTSDVELVVAGIVGILPQLISLGTKLSVGLLILFRIDFRFTLVILLIGVMVCIGNRIYSERFRHFHKEVQESGGQVRAFLQECIENLMVIKSFSNEEMMEQKLTNYQEIHYQIKKKRNAVSNLANTIVYVMFTAGYYAALAWGAIQISRGLLTFGTLTAFLQIIGQIRAPFRNISGLIPQYYSMIGSAERLMDLEQIEEEEASSMEEDFEKISEEMQAIVFEEVGFSYENRSVLEHFSVRLEKGSLTAVAGPSGAGKSTMMKLLLGLLQCEEGQIYFDLGKKKIPADAGTRKMFAYVPQGNMILSGTIRENLVFSGRQVSEEEICRAAKMACIWEYIQELPDGLDTVLRERGNGLSEGQIQRIAIARALLSDAPVLLLDECTSALDEKTEEQVLNNLKQMKSKTILCISHKVAAFACCDHKIVLDGSGNADGN